MRTFGRMMPISAATRLADRRDPRQQIAAVFRAGELHQRGADLDFHRVDRQEILDPLFRLPLGVGGDFGLLASLYLVGFRFAA